MINTFVYKCALCASINSALLGYDIGVAGGAMFVAQGQLSLSDFETEVIISALNFASIPGSLLSRFISDNQGRTKTLAMCSIFFLCGSILMASANSFGMLLVGRIFLGIGTGCGLTIGPLYISEISPSKSRGTLVSFTELAINIGILLGFTANALLGSLDPSISWRLMLGLGGIVPIFGLYFSLCIMPETPRFLMKVGKVNEARLVMEKLCLSKEGIDTTMVEMKQEIEASQSVSRGASFISLLFNRDPVIRLMLLTVCSAALAQQLSGVEVLMYYTPFILEDIGFSSREQIFSLTALMGLAKTVTLFYVGCLLDAKGAGRRPLLITSYFGMAVALLLLCVGVFVGKRALVLIGIFGYVSFFSCGSGPVTWLMASEIMPTNIRAHGMVIATSLNRIAGGIVSLTFLTLSGLSMGGVLLFFSFVCFAFACLAVQFAPETKGRALEEMYSIFSALVESKQKRRPLDDQF